MPVREIIIKMFITHIKLSYDNNIDTPWMHATTLMYKTRGIGMAKKI